MDSKNRIANEILPLILEDRKKDTWYVEPFVGGCNTIDKVSGFRIGNDSNYYLIEMWKALQNGWVPPDEITKDLHKDIRINKDKYEPFLVGWVGFNCSYSGVFFGGYAGKTNTKIGTIRDYQTEAIKNVMKQVNYIKDVKFYNEDYRKLEIPKQSIIYCDPPYANVSSYKVSEFDTGEFWQWCKEKVQQGHKVFVSEYSAPDDWECIWHKNVKSSLSANGKSGGNKDSVEKLFKLKI